MPAQKRCLPPPRAVEPRGAPRLQGCPRLPAVATTTVRSLRLFIGQDRRWHWYVNAIHWSWIILIIPVLVASIDSPSYKNHLLDASICESICDGILSTTCFACPWDDGDGNSDGSRKQGIWEYKYMNSPSTVKNNPKHVRQPNSGFDSPVKQWCNYKLHTGKIVKNRST